MLSEQSVKRPDARCSYLPSIELDPARDVDILRKADLGVVFFYHPSCPIYKLLLDRADDVAEEMKDVVVRSSVYKNIGKVRDYNDFGTLNKIEIVPSILIVHNGLTYVRDDVYNKVFSKKEFLDYLSREMEPAVLNGGGNVLRPATPLV